MSLHGFVLRITQVILLGGYLLLNAVSAGEEPPLLPGTFARLNGGEPLTIVCLGDSVTGVFYHTGGRRAYPEMLQLALQKKYPRSKPKVINAGINGQSTSQCVARLEDDALRHHPHLVTVMFGLNDMITLSLDQYRANLVDIANRCRNAGAEVLLCTPNSVEETERRPLSKLQQYVDAMHAVGKQQGIPVSDVFAAYGVVHQRDPVAFSLLLSDPAHPNMDGHKLSAGVIAKAISGQVISVADEPPPSALPHTLSLLSKKRPIKVLAMPPYDTMIPQVLAKLQPDAKIEVTAWGVSGKALSEIEADAKRVRELRPDLVVIAVPLMPIFEPIPIFARAYGWILNWSLSFAKQEWDVLALPPSLNEPQQTDDQRRQDELVQRLILAQDLLLVRRKPGDTRPATEVLADWLLRQSSQ